MKLHTNQYQKEEVYFSWNPNVKIDYHPSPEDDPKTRRPDISLAKKLLNWEPKDRRKALKKRTSILNRFCQRNMGFYTRIYGIAFYS